MHWEYGWGMGWVMVSWWIFWVVVIAGFVWLIFSGVGGPASTDDSPERILKRRYASGEISSEDYQQRLSEIRK